MIVVSQFLAKRLSVKQTVQKQLKKNQQNPIKVRWKNQRQIVHKKQAANLYMKMPFLILLPTQQTYDAFPEFLHFEMRKKNQSLQMSLFRFFFRRSRNFRKEVMLHLSQLLTTRKLIHSHREALT